MDATEETLPQRLTSLWDHLGLGAAHVAAQMPGDLAGFVAAAPDRLAGWCCACRRGSIRRRSPAWPGAC